MGWMVLAPLLAAGGLAVLVLFSIQGLKAWRPGGGRGAEVLRERYARGEIDRDEFRRMQRDLRG